jgi:RNA polymerase sigma factor (sigma-70 family)
MTRSHSLDPGPADAVHPRTLAERTVRVLTLTRTDPPALLPRIANGDQAAVAECVATFGGMVLVLARRWSTDAADAEDAVQEVFFDLWKHAGRYDAAKASERGFVAMIARRRLIDRLRRRSREVPVEGIPDGYDLPDESGDHGAQVAGALDARPALEQLTPMQRRFIERHLLDGKTHDEIARESQVPLGTVKSHIRRGLLKARALLTGRAERTQEDEA